MANAAKKFAYFTCVLMITQSEVSSTGIVPTRELGNLSFLITFVRHGARTPVMKIKGNPNNNFWTDGIGELTNIGKQQVFDLGQKLREQYCEFISTKYSPDEIKVKSTLKDRTIMSAQCFLAGMYPPKGAQVWNPELPWQPIPVYLLDYDVDKIVKDATSKVRESCSYKFGVTPDSVYEQYKETVNAIKEVTGMNYSCLSIQYLTLLDTLLVEKYYNLTLPFGLDSIFQSIEELKHATFTKLFSHPEVASMGNSQLLLEAAKILEAHRNRSIPQKIFSFHVHDANIALLLSALTTSEITSPEFAATVILEVYNNNDVYYVQFLHRKTPLSESEPQYIKNCGQICPLDTFIALVRSSTVPPGNLPCPC